MPICAAHDSIRAAAVTAAAAPRRLHHVPRPRRLCHAPRRASRRYLSAAVTAAAVVRADGPRYRLAKGAGTARPPLRRSSGADGDSAAAAAGGQSGALGGVGGGGAAATKGEQQMDATDPGGPRRCAAASAAWASAAGAGCCPMPTLAAEEAEEAEAWTAVAAAGSGGQVSVCSAVTERLGVTPAPAHAPRSTAAAPPSGRLPPRSAQTGDAAAHARGRDVGGSGGSERAGGCGASPTDEATRQRMSSSSPGDPRPPSSPPDDAARRGAAAAQRRFDGIAGHGGRQSAEDVGLPTGLSEPLRAAAEEEESLWSAAPGVAHDSEPLPLLPPPASPPSVTHSSAE